MAGHAWRATAVGSTSLAADEAACRAYVFILLWLEQNSDLEMAYSVCPDWAEKVRESFGVIDPSFEDDSGAFDKHGSFLWALTE